MKKTLRYVFVALLAITGMGNAFAEDVIWSEDWTGCDPTVLPSNANYAFTGSTFNDDGTVKSGTKIYNEALAGGEAPELLVSKNGGSFTATVALNGKSGNMTLAFKCNKKITVTVEGATMGDNTGSGNDYVYPLSNASGTLTIKFENTLTANARLDNIELYQGQGKKPAGLSWGTSARTVTLGSNDNVFPELQNANQLPVSYSSSETAVATISADGTIALVAAGQTVITAEFAGNDEYEAGKAEYTLTVKDAAAPEPTAELITVAKALELINALEDGKTTSEKYQVKGYIVGTPDFQRKGDGSLYGNVNFDMADAVGGSPLLTVYRAKDFEGKNYTEETVNRLKEGDEVVIEGKLQKFVKDGVMTPEITTGGILVSVNGQTSGIAGVTVSKSFEGAVYNVAGQKVSEAYKGLVIVNGKKVVKK